MQLYHSPTSPFVRKVMVLLHETGQLDDVELIAAIGTPIDSAKMPTALNPLGKIPALNRADGPALYDSSVICQFLDDRAGGKVYPEARKWEVMTLESTADGIMDAAVLMTYEWRVRPEDKRFPEWVEGQWSKIERALDALSTKWMSHLAGPLDMGQISVACALSYLDFRHDDRGWRKGHDALADWHQGFAERASMTETEPPA